VGNQPQADHDETKLGSKGPRFARPFGLDFRDQCPDDQSHVVQEAGHSWSPIAGDEGKPQSMVAVWKSARSSRIASRAPSGRFGTEQRAQIGPWIARASPDDAGNKATTVPEAVVLISPSLRRRVRSVALEATCQQTSREGWPGVGA
jgi:hypothetical protein